MNVNIIVLGSGSSGNAILLVAGNNAILIDAGFSRKELLTRLNKCSIDPAIIKAVLITHEHSDHTKGLRVFADHLRIPAYTTYNTAKYLKTKNLLSAKQIIFDSGTPFQVLDFNVHPFRVAHDAIDPVGFIVSLKGIEVGIALDLGHINTLAKCRLKGCNALLLESNYEVELLKNSQRPLRLKKRIASKFGHLSNDDAMSSLESILTENTTHLLLGHISSECNDHDILHSKASEKLLQLKRTDIQLTVLKQNTPSEIIFL